MTGWPRWVFRGVVKGDG